MNHLNLSENRLVRLAGGEEKPVDLVGIGKGEKPGSVLYFQDTGEQSKIAESIPVEEYRGIETYPELDLQRLGGELQKIRDSFHTPEKMTATEIKEQWGKLEVVAQDLGRLQGDIYAKNNSIPAEMKAELMTKAKQLEAYALELRAKSLPLYMSNVEETNINDTKAIELARKALEQYETEKGEKANWDSKDIVKSEVYRLGDKGWDAVFARAILNSTNEFPAARSAKPENTTVVYITTQSGSGICMALDEKTGAFISMDGDN